MSIADSPKETIGAIFGGNIFQIPSYQRKYIWTDKECGDLWNDIEEAVKNSMNHFFGTLIFREIESEGLATLQSYEIIDGQQRITTLYILLSELISKLPDSKIKDSLREKFIGSPGNLKLSPQGKDIDFLDELVFKFDSIDESVLRKRSQRLMFKTKKYFRSILSSYSQEEIEKKIVFIQKNIEVLILNVKRQSEAIRMFEIINDRGLPLKILDKCKSVLMLYSTMYLDEKLNDVINNAFEKVYDSFDDIIMDRDRLKILGRFSENTLFTHHYSSARKLFQETWDFKKGAESIFEDLKSKCESLKRDRKKLSEFIKNYADDFSEFSLSYADLVSSIETNELYVKPFQFLEFTATLYPLIVRLHNQKKLGALLKELESIEVRIYKFRGTNPVKDAYVLSSLISEDELDTDVIKKELIDFNNRFMNDGNFRYYLNSAVYGNTATIKYIFLEYNNSLKSCRIINDVNEYRKLEVEHIFSRNPNFSVKSYGFKDDEYENEINKIGNLTLLERDTSNASPKDKADRYIKSDTCMTNRLGSKIKSEGFTKKEMDERGEELIRFCLKRF